MDETEVRVASWPHWYEINPYLEHFYRALEPYGVRHCKNVPLELDPLLGHSPPIDVLHLHWPEPYWRDGAPTPFHQLIRLLRLLRLVRRVRRAGSRFVWTVHNLEHHEGAGVVDRLGYRCLHRRADLRLFHSRWSERVARDRYGASGDTVVIPLGSFDGAYPPPRPRQETMRSLPFHGAHRLLLCFGQIRAYKGFDVAVEAVDALRADGFRLVIAGRPVGSYPEKVRRMCRSRDHVLLIPEVVGEQRLADLIGAADAVLLPYRRVTGSAALLTALTLSRGVVATSIPYFREVLAPEPDASVLVPPDDSGALAEGIRRYFDVSTEERSRAARRLAQRYAWKRTIAPFARWLLAESARDRAEVG